MLVTDLVDEVTLVERAKTDPDAFGLLYEQYVDKIYNYVYYRTGNRHDAEDLTAKVFYQALNHIPRFVQRGAPFSSWLYRIAHNLVANWHRDRSRRKVVSLDKLALVRMQEDASPFEQAAQNEQREVLLEAIRELPADRQQLLLLKFVERLPNAQIGKIMGRSEGAIKSLYHRTLVALRQDLADQRVE
jgi:RNA polymerase sigma-70 factor (ECF subfamily)